MKIIWIAYVEMAFDSMKCNAIYLLGGLDNDVWFDSSVVQYHVMRYRAVHQ